jgi:monomeric isocitrate dehydrogenase
MDVSITKPLTWMIRSIIQDWVNIAVPRAQVKDVRQVVSLVKHCATDEHQLARSYADNLTRLEG